MNNVVPLRRTRPNRAPQASPAPRQVYVIFTTLEHTLLAARTANELAPSMGAGVSVLHFRPVSYALPLESAFGVSPAEDRAFTGQLKAEGISATVRVCLCRSERAAVAAAVPPQSLVVVGGRRAWWPTRASRWARTLEALGHTVVSRAPVNTPPGVVPGSHHENTRSLDHQMEKARA